MSGSGLRSFSALLLSALLALGGCSSVALGPVQKPEIYPDRTTHESAFTTFLWAWNTGDVRVLQQVMGAWLHHDLLREIEANGAEKVSAFYRGSGDLELRELEWKDEGEALAYLRAVLHSSDVDRIELDFSLLLRPDGWVVTGKRLLR